MPPSQIAHYLALVGDTSDNIPGLDGVGPKTASKWLAECGGSVECVLEKAAELKPERFREMVAANADRLRINLKLTTLNLGLAPVKPEWRTPQPEELFRLLEGSKCARRPRTRGNVMPRAVPRRWGQRRPPVLLPRRSRR